MKLKDYLKENNISISEMARRIGLSPGYFWLITKGQRGISPDVARTLNSITEGKVSLDEFFPIREPKICPCCNRRLPKNYRVKLKEHPNLSTLKD